MLEGDRDVSEPENVKTSVFYIHGKVTPSIVLLNMLHHPT